jgi:hypothetical protein
MHNESLTINKVIMNYTQVEITPMVLGDQQVRQPCEMGIIHDEPEKLDYYEKASAYCPRSHYEFLWSVIDLPLEAPRAHDFADLRGRHGSCTSHLRKELLTPVGVGKPNSPVKPSSAESGGHEAAARRRWRT